MKLAFLLVALAIVGTAAALDLEPGQPVSVTTELPAGRYESLSVEYLIPETGFAHERAIADGERSVTTRLQPNLDIGTYELIVLTKADRRVVEEEAIPLRVGRPRATQNATPNASANRTQTSAPRTTITIPAIPDVLPGSTFVIPVTISGAGRYELTVPALTFGTYEVPPAVNVNGTRTVPVLVHIDERAGPGLYAVPISANNESVTARVRVIKYREQNLLWLLIPLGILLVIAGATMIFLSRRQQPPRRNDKSDELITYY
jgi:hypothetical protein